MCTCLFPSDKTSIFFDCSNNNLKSIPSELIKVLQLLPSLKEIELNFDNNFSIRDLPNATMQGFDFITKISAKSNSIETISVDNLPANLTEIDLSRNKLKSLTTDIKNSIGNMETLQKVMLANNPRICDDHFLEPIQFKEKVDYESFVCIDGESSYPRQIHFIFNYNIQRHSRTVMFAMLFPEEKYRSTQWSHS